jgi:hypothetical protein
MANAPSNLDQMFVEMRARCLSLAADLDRLDNTAGKPVGSDPRLVKLNKAINVLLENRVDRAQRVQMIFSDMTAPPAYGKARHQ